MKTVKLTKAQAQTLNRKPLVGRSVTCKPRGAVYSNRGTAIHTFIKDL